MFKCCKVTCKVPLELWTEGINACKQQYDKLWEQSGKVCQQCFKNIGNLDRLRIESQESDNINCKSV